MHAPLRYLLRHLLAGAAVCSAGAAAAHDTWFQPLPPAAPGDARLALGTGNRFPLQEFTVGAASLARQGCTARTDGAQPVALEAVRDTDRALHLRARARPAGAALSCWAQQQAFEVEIKPETVAVYFAEIRPDDAVRAAWDEMRARGVPWKERYTKHARIELPGRLSTPTPAAPSGMDMDVLLDASAGPPRAGDTLGFQVLRDGRPLAGLSVQLRNDLSPVGLWGRTDADGRVAFRVPLAGRWLLRGTDLRLSDSVPDTWESRFVTLAFSVGEGPAPEPRRPAG